MRSKGIIWIVLIFMALSCNGFIEFVPENNEKPKTEIDEQGSGASTQEVVEGGEPAPATEPTPEPPTPTPEPPTPTPLPTATPFFLESLSRCPDNTVKDIYGKCCQVGFIVNEATGLCAYCPKGDVHDQASGLCKSCPSGKLLENGVCTDKAEDIAAAGVPPPTLRHGLLIAFVLPVLILGIPWVIAEIFVVRYVQPRGIDLSKVRIKAQDGLFIEATISLTARRSLTLASTRMTWPRVREFVEKALEQELIHEALNYPTLDDLERNLKGIAENFINLSVVRELSNDFGLEVMRFNVETRFPQETMDALNRKAEAAAGGTAYLAYAAAAHLDPDSRESRELYKVYQETRGQVDAARNLGGGLTNIAEIFTRRSEQGDINDHDSGD